MVTPQAGAEVDRATAAALKSSRLGVLPSWLVSELLVNAARIRAPAGSIVRRVGAPGQHLELVVTGLVRGFLTSPDGRRLTIRYCRPGGLLGAVSLFNPDYTMPGSNQAIVDSEVVAFMPSVVRDLAEREPLVTRALLEELSDRVYSYVGEVHDGAFSTVRQRVARHLLDLAAEQQTSAALIASISQQELAAAVGSVREVIVRVLRDLRREGLVTTDRDLITIRDPTGLLAELYPGVLLPGPASAAERAV
jgi:CRP/FNR family transcriptional regulator